MRHGWGGKVWGCGGGCACLVGAWRWSLRLGRLACRILTLTQTCWLVCDYLQGVILTISLLIQSCLVPVGRVVGATGRRAVAFCLGSSLVGFPGCRRAWWREVVCWRAGVQEFLNGCAGRVSGLIRGTRIGARESPAGVFSAMCRLGALVSRGCSQAVGRRLSGCRQHFERY